MKMCSGKHSFVESLDSESHFNVGFSRINGLFYSWGRFLNPVFTEKCKYSVEMHTVQFRSFIDYY